MPCSSMIVTDGLIEYLGDDPDRRIPDLQYDTSAKIIDLEGKTVFPGFVDAHMHFLQFGASLVKVALDNCKDLDDIRATIRGAAKAMPEAKRILCRGWRQSTTNREALTSMIDDLDSRPIFIDSDDLHSEWCNSAALKEMGIDRNTPDPIDGVIHRDGDGNPTGLISEGPVITMVWPFLIGQMSTMERMNCIRTGIQEYHSNGYTGVIEMAMDPGAWELLERMREEEPLGIRVAAYWIIIPSDDDEVNLAQVREAVRMRSKYNLENSPDFRVAGIKVICDGVVDSCTAALSKPYLVSPGGKGELNWQPSRLKKVVELANFAGLQIAMHAIGDAAVRLAIDLLEGLKARGQRHRIEHLELTHPDDAHRLGELGITASIQPMHSDPSILGAWPELVGERCEWAFAHQSFLDGGAQLAIGTDSPTAPHQPFPSFFVANTRQSVRDTHNHWKVNSRTPLRLHDVLDAATYGASFSCFAEGRTGSLEIGKMADFVVVAGLRRCFNSEDLLTAHVEETWLGGRSVYEKSTSKT